MKEDKSNNARRNKSHPSSKYFKRELSIRLRSIISTFPEVKNKSQAYKIAIENTRKLISNVN